MNGPSTQRHPNYVYLLIIDEIDNRLYRRPRPGEGESSATEGIYQTLDNANAAAREYFKQWSRDDMEVYEESIETDGRVNIHVEFPEGEVMTAYVRKEKVEGFQKQEEECKGEGWVGGGSLDSPQVDGGKRPWEL